MTDDDAVVSSTQQSAGFTTILGVDCATQPKKVGLARAHSRDGDWHLTDTQVCSAAEPPDKVLARWIEEDPDCLLALDAPLGWPSAMGTALSSHRAGQPVGGHAKTLFNRATDRHVHASLGKRPLDVGADRIARTALATVELLQTLRECTGAPLPLAWSPVEPVRPATIEVYPAATLLAHGVDAKGYKATTASAARLAIEGPIGRWLTTEGGFNVQAADDNVVDAVLCVIGGLDFAAGAARGPSDRYRAEREGWIWFREGAGEA